VGMTEAGGMAGRQSMPPEPGCYEIRFRLTGLGAFRLFGLVLLALGIFRYQSPLYEQVILVAIGGLVALRYVIAVVSRMVLFRADTAGIALGTLGRLGLSSSTVFIPWTDIRKIALYKITRRAKRVGQTGSYMVIVAHGGAYGSGRRIDSWRLDPERLAAVAAAAAPGVPVVDAGDIDPWVDADLKRFLHLDSK
jgi:hypothetical protein